MRRLWCWVFLLSAGPAMAQSVQYDGPWGLQQHRADGYRPGESRQQEHHHERRRPRKLTLGAIEPSRLGPAQVGFWYRCDSPAGYYPYIPACQTPWRIVPSVPLR